MVNITVHLKSQYNEFSFSGKSKSIKYKRRGGLRKSIEFVRANVVEVFISPHSQQVGFSNYNILFILRHDVALKNYKVVIIQN